MKIIIKIILSVLLFACIYKMPYGYFQMVRLVGCALFVWLAYLEYKENRIITTALCVGCALLFNPIVKVYFKRDLWNDIDVIISIGLVVWIIIDLIKIFLYNKKYSINQ